MEKLVYVHTNGNDYFLAYHSDEVHLFQVNKDETLTFEAFEQANIMNDKTWKSHERFDIEDPMSTYFNENSIVVAQISLNGLTIFDEGLYRERKEFYHHLNK